MYILYIVCINIYIHNMSWFFLIYKYYHLKLRSKIIYLSMVPLPHKNWLRDSVLKRTVEILFMTDSLLHGIFTDP